MDPNSLKNGDLKYSLSVQISVAFFKKALDHFENKDYLKCLISLDSAIKYNFFNSTYYIFKALVLGVFIGRYNYAIEEVEKALILDPHSENVNKLKKELLRLQFNNDVCNYYI
ncbi:unnamed protein product [marine sediment metagenome]|uniref:Tetratricopeptide repeat protein n=1 Tax=marine sediment metagenome TaxID=412755 RepID=X0WZD9_9ZZZZ